MIEKIFVGSKKYWFWVFSLMALVGIGLCFYLEQFQYGLGITGMSRDVSWGLYIGQFTFFVGVAASAVMVVLPYYLHNHKAFGRITILGEFLAIASVVVCLLFILVDLGQPARFLNIILYPSPNSVMFWDMIALNGYLFLNLLIGWTNLSAEYKGLSHPAWLKPFIYISIPWAISIHTVTAFIYAGLPGRHFWLTAIMAARFLASAFSSGPALLVLLALIMRRFSKFDPGKEAIFGLSKIITYAMIANVFFLGLELFTCFYSGIPAHCHSFEYLYGGGRLTMIMWLSALLACLSLILLINPKTRNNTGWLTLSCCSVFASLWIEKGFGLVVGGFIPNPLGKITEYWPSLPEVFIALGVWAIGLLILTGLYKIAAEVKSQESNAA
ncbi:MAG: polysulfide reductase NrfD [bacterium]|nr:polysulfide reductase NrfD [bacterium]